MITNDEEVTTVYADPDRDDWNEIYLPAFRQMNVRQTAATLGVDPSTVTLLRRGNRRPRHRLRAKIIRLVGQWSAERLRQQGISPPFDHRSASIRFLAGASAP